REEAVAQAGEGELFIMVASFEVNKVFAAILVLINVLLFSLGFGLLGVATETLHMSAAYSEFAISLLGFYACGAIFLNNFFGRTVLPLGKPFGFIARGPLAQPAAKQPLKSAA
ncbi:MAG: hypothetical protein HGA47_11495, partial [Zoogloea sp.]|nr:hypothetical protein [Zoogloea sp.]